MSELSKAASSSHMLPSSNTDKILAHPIDDVRNTAEQHAMYNLSDLLRKLSTAVMPVRIML